MRMETHQHSDYNRVKLVIDDKEMLQPQDCIEVLNDVADQIEHGKGIIIDGNPPNWLLAAMVLRCAYAKWIGVAIAKGERYVISRTNDPSTPLLMTYSTDGEDDI